MVLPDYKNSIVNLMSSIQAAYGIKSRYSRLKQLDVKELSSKKNIVLMVFDGLGYDYVVKQGKGSIFEKYLKSKITSVFPSTTATAITSFYTGKPAQQHSITGWFMYAKEVGGIIANLPFMMRGGYPLKINPKKIFTEKPIFDKLKADSYVIMHEPITFSEYNNVNTGKAKKIPYNDISSFFSQTKKVIL